MIVRLTQKKPNRFVNKCWPKKTLYWYIDLPPSLRHGPTLV